MPEDRTCVVFDWGGVLLRICRGFAEGCAAAGLEVRAGATDPELYDVRRALSARYQVGVIGEEEFFDGVSAAMGGLYTPVEISRIHDAWLLGEYAGVGTLVDALHARGVVTGLLSNTNGRHWARRERDFPTAGRLVHQHASHLLGLAKPGAEIYAAFEACTGLTPDEIVFFDDLGENIDAARTRGWHAVRVDHTGDTAGQMAQALAGLGLL
jgi:HAD superfamily hydrolase (TIGR01509 family)